MLLNKQIYNCREMIGRLTQWSDFFYLLNTLLKIVKFHCYLPVLKNYKTEQKGY